MICKKKNGHLKMSLRAGGLLCLILCLVFSLFSSTLSASAISANFGQIFGRYTSNWTSSEGTWFDSNARTAVRTLDEVVQSNGFFNTGSSYSTGATYPGGISAVYFSTDNVAFTQNNLSMHLEMNLVFASMRASGSYFDFPYPLQFNVISCNRNLASQAVSYHVTDWSKGYQSGDIIFFTSNKTMTMYIDIVLKDLPVGQQGAISCGVDAGQVFARTNSGATNNSAVWFVEKFDNNIEYFAGLNDALQVATNNALNVQTQILEWQRQYQIEQYELERQREQDFQNRSDSSSTDGGNATSSAQNATSSLLGAITSIYDQLLHPHTTNCVIGPVSVYDLNLGNLDFCTGFDIPQPLVAIGSLIMIGLIILLGWSILKAGISLYNEILGGKG